ncbi:MAG: hypothetical protein ACK5KM_09715 [Hyphomicrobiaceae bacterium]
MSTPAKTVNATTADLAGDCMPTLYRIVSGRLTQLATQLFYVVGRLVLALFRAPRSDTGVPEAMLGFVVVMALTVALVRLPLRIVYAVLKR